MIIIIWYFNLHFIKKIRSQKIEIQTPQRNVLFSPDSLPRFDFVYKNVKRDPFYVIIDTVAKEPAPRFSLRGIVLSKQGALAVIEMPDGNVYTMKKGDKYMGVKIKKITPKTVILDIRGREQVLNVWE